MAATSDRASEAPRGRVLAFDPGTVRTGVAVSDETGVIATPLAVIEKATTSAGLDTIVSLVDTYAVERVLVGLPRALSGSESVSAARSRSFAAQLRQRLTIPVELVDERFTSQMADTLTAESGTARDSLAAAHLLQGWLEAQA